MTTGTDPARLAVAPVPSEPSRAVPFPLGLGAALVGIMVAVPAAYIVIRAGAHGWSGIVGSLEGAGTGALLVRSVALALAVTASAIAIGVPLASLLTRSDVPGKRLWTVLAAMPLVIPSYVGGYVFVAAFGPRGLVQGWLEPLGVDRLPSIYGFGGAWLVLTLFTYPYVFLTVRAALRNVDPSLEEAGRSLGLSPRQSFTRIVLPQIRPAITTGALLVALYALHDFGAVSLLRYDTFTRAIYLHYQASFDRTSAAVLACVLVAVTFVFLAIETRARGRVPIHPAHTGARKAMSVVPLRKWRWPAVAVCALLVIVALGVPLGVIAYWLARALRTGEAGTLTLTAGYNSVRASALGAVLALLAAWPVAVLGARYAGRGSRMLERASYVGYALPGIVVALSLVFLGARYVPVLYQTLPMLAFAYVILFLPQAAGAVRANLSQISPTLEDASHALGRSRSYTARRVLVPLVRPGAVAALALVFLTAMKELPATLLLAPTGFSTLATEIWGATNAAAFGRAAAPAFVLVGLAAAAMTILMVRER